MYNLINEQFSFDNLVCLEAVTTNEYRVSLEKDNYKIPFTAQEWEKLYPSIPAKFIFFEKEKLFCSEMMYIDKEHYIAFPTRMYYGKFLNASNEIQFEDFMNASIARQMEAYQNKNYIRLLTPIVSEQSGNRVISMLSYMLENETPNPELYNAFLECYVYCDCGITKLTDLAKKNLLLCKSAEQKEYTSRQLERFPDMINVYRGEGSNSTPAKSAFSWTTDLDTAYFFASRMGAEKAKVIHGLVPKSKVIEYYTKRNEWEILALPEDVTILNTKYCVEFEWFIQLISSGVSEYTGEYELEPFSAYSSILRIQNLYDKHHRNIADHDFSHTCRVCCLAIFLYRTLVLAEEDPDSENKSQIFKEHSTLIDAVMYHDIGRVDSSENQTHGVSSYKIYRADKEDNAVVKFLVECHCIDDEAARTILDKHLGGDERVWTLYKILKDADALDRLRFGRGNDGLKIKYLRFETSKSLIPAAAKLQNFRFDFDF